MIREEFNMHKRLRRLLSTGMAAVFSILSLAAPVAAQESSLSDLNGDGVVDVFDFVMTKRVSVAENAPPDLSLSSAECYPGETVTIRADIDNNPGFSFSKFAVNYGDVLTPVKPENASSFTPVNKEAFPDLSFSTYLIEDFNLIICNSKSTSYTEGNGTVFSIALKVPDDAEPGTVYQLSFQDIELSHKGTKLPMLTQRGKITVLAPGTPKTEEPVTEPLPVTSVLSNPVTTAPASQTAVSASTVTVPAVTTAAVTATMAAGTTTCVPTTVATAATTTVQAKPTSTRPTTKPLVITATVSTTFITTTVRPYLCHGIDISSWQGDKVDFQKAKNDPKAQFVILRAGFGKYLKQVDTTFYSNYDRAKAAGIPVGAYWYSYAKTPEEARIEANVCAQVLGDRTFEYPIAFDIEEKDVLAMDISKISAIIDAFCSEMEKKGFFSQIYCSSFYLNNKINQDVKSRYDVWVANYNVAVPSFTGNYGMWQYGVSTCEGFTGDVDMDYCYRDYPSAIKRAKLNNYK